MPKHINNSFLISIPVTAHAQLVEKITELKHVQMSEDKTGLVSSASGDGVKFSFRPVIGTNNVEITVLENPNNVPQADIKARLEQDVAAIAKQ